MTKDAVFPEMVSELWETVLWISVFAEIRKHSLLTSDELYAVNAYLEDVKVRDSDDVDGVLWSLAVMLDEAMDENPTCGNPRKDTQRR
jgi:hypothetical protein